MIGVAFPAPNRGVNAIGAPQSKRGEPAEVAGADPSHQVIPQEGSLHNS